jgi:hypothetical protein
MEDEDEVIDKINAIDFVPPLSKYMQNDYTMHSYGAQVLGRLIRVFDDETIGTSIDLAISTLTEYCEQDPGNIEIAFAGKIYMIADFLGYALPKAI